MREVIGHHCHVFPRGFISSEHPEHGTLQRLLELAEEAGLSAVTVFAPFQHYLPDLDVDAWLAKEVEGHENVIPFATISPVRDDALDALKRAVDLGLRGVKMHPWAPPRWAIDDPRVQPFYDLAEEYKLLLCFHTGPHGWYLNKYRPLLLDDVAQDHPNLRIVLEHTGSSVSLFGEALAVLENTYNTYAGVDHDFLLREDDLNHLRIILGSWIASEKSISSRLIYACGYHPNGDKESDFVTRTRHEISMIAESDLPEEVKANLFSGSLRAALDG